MNLLKHFRELLRVSDLIRTHGFFLLEDLAQEDNHHRLQVNHSGCALFLAFYLFLAWPLYLAAVDWEVYLIRLQPLKKLICLAYEFEGSLVPQHSKYSQRNSVEQGDKELVVGSFAASYQEPHEHGLPTHLLDLGEDFGVVKEDVRLLCGYIRWDL